MHFGGVVIEEVVFDVCTVTTDDNMFLITQIHSQ